MESNATTPEAALDATAPPMSFFQRLMGIYFEPSKTFADINRNRSWLGIYILVVIVSIGASYTLMTRMDRETYMRKSMANPIVKRFLSPEQLEAQIQANAAQPRSAWERYSPIVMIPLGVYVGYLLIALIFLLAFMLTGAGLSFRKCFTAAIWGMGPPGIIVSLLSILFMFLKSPADLDINPVNNVVSNLGLMVNPETSPVLNSIFSSIDVFTVWTISLLAIGFAAFSEKRLTIKAAATTIIILWLLWVLLKAGFFAILG